jgi:transcriptional regulator with XRE-family HTH domain
MARPPLPRTEVGERKRIGATLRALRGTRSVAEVARELSAYRLVVSPAYLGNIEAGRKRLTPEIAATLAVIYGVPLIAITHPDYYRDAA